MSDQLTKIEAMKWQGDEIDKLRKRIAKFDAAKKDGVWNESHLIFQMAAEIDDLSTTNSELFRDVEVLKQRVAELEDAGNKLLPMLRGDFIKIDGDICESTCRLCEARFDTVLFLNKSPFPHNPDCPTQLFKEVCDE